MPQDWEPEDWSEQQARRIAAEVLRLRGRRSAQWLSDRTAELGHRVSRAVITDLENGRRRNVTVSELIVLAAALDTTPVALLYPGPYDDIIETLPGVEALQLWAAQWFSGLAPARELYSDRDSYDQNMASLISAREVLDLEERKRRMLQLATDPAARELAVDIQQEITVIQEKIDTLKDRGSGG